MALNENFKKVKTALIGFITKSKSLFVKKSEVSDKSEINTHSFKALGIALFFIFITVVMLMPDEQSVEFAEKIEETRQEEKEKSNDSRAPSLNAQTLWGSPKMTTPRSYAGGADPDHNTSMIVLGGGNNAKTQLRAGLRLPLRIFDKFIVSDEPVPVLAELLFDSVTDSGLRLPAGTRFYGEASFQRNSERADIRFKQISLPNGQIKPISGLALGKDGQPGVKGKVRSDGVKNTAGQIITTFIGGLAAGSMQTDILGQSKGGIENGLLSAVSETAKSRAQDYGEKLKTERQWIEVPANTECDAVLSDALNLQQRYEP